MMLNSHQSIAILSNLIPSKRNCLLLSSVKYNLIYKLL